MRVARIITSQQHGPDEDQLKQQLQAAGYEVEVTAPGQASSRAADLEIELETVPAAQALDAVMRIARDGADVFIAPGVVPPQVAPPEPQIEVAEAEREPGEAAQLSDETRGPSFRQRIGKAWAERQRRRTAAAEERRWERERREQEQEERRREQALQLQRRLEQEERQRVECMRLQNEQMAREAALRAQRARRIEENERRRAAELEAQRLRTAGQAEAHRLAAMAAQMQAPPRAPKPSVVATPPASTPRAAGRPISRPTRRSPSPRDLRWQRAALLASLVALMAMLGFAAAMNLHPVAPVPARILQNSAQQKVPFGAATIAPTATTAKAPALTTKPLAKLAPKALPRPSAVRQKPVVHQAPRARRSGNDIVAQDEVVVHRYGSPSGARAETSGVRRFSDQ